MRTIPKLWRESIATSYFFLPVSRDRFLNAMLGPKCDRCMIRVYPGDQRGHDLDCD